MNDRRETTRRQAEASEHAQRELAELLAIASERRAKMGVVTPAKRGGQRPA